MASWAGWCWRGPRCSPCRCGASTQDAPHARRTGEEQRDVSAKKNFRGRARQDAAPAAYRGSARRAERDLPGKANPRLSARSRTARAQKVLAAAPKIPFLRSRPLSVQLLRRKPVLAQQLEQPSLTHQVQRAHDHQAVALAVQEL